MYVLCRKTRFFLKNELKKTTHITNYRDLCFYVAANKPCIYRIFESAFPSFLARPIKDVVADRVLLSFKAKFYLPRCKG